jgi:nucleoside-triphosphatase
MDALKILLTGRPGVGKTTVIQRTLALLDRPLASGFYTGELRGPRGRLGFEAVTLDGRKQVLAHVDFSSRGFEREIVPSIDPAAQMDADLIVVDEIGKMECFSPCFREAVRRALDSPLPLLGTIAKGGGGFFAEVRARPDVELIEVTMANRERLPVLLAARLSQSGEQRKKRKGEVKS